MGMRVLLVVVLISFAPLITTNAAAGVNATRSAGRQQKQKQKPLAPALIVFGDSIVDPGNNNDIHTIIKADFPPYGTDFQNHRATGRFCNGRIPTDFIASRLGIKELLPPYLTSEPLDKHDLVTGVSFASGGTGFDPLTPQLASVISLPDQLTMFHDYLGKVRDAAGDARVSDILSRGVFAICAGSDDVANTYFTLRARSSYDHASYARLLVQHATAFVEDLIRAGAPRRLHRHPAHRLRPVAAHHVRRSRPGLLAGPQRDRRRIQRRDGAAAGGAAGQVPRHAARLHGHLRLPLRHDDAPAQLRLHAVHQRMLRHGPPRGLRPLQRRHLRRLPRRRRLPLLGQLPPNGEGVQDPRRLRLRQLRQAHPRLAYHYFHFMRWI
uniref:GDSL esterase/lipase EXL3 n=1 Tax=Zea mays TaxID=4577 RepID=B4G1U3_MAIZE|nr:unknown [Zea mays]